MLIFANFNSNIPFIYPSFSTFALVMRLRSRFLFLISLIFALVCIPEASAIRSPKIKYPGGKYYIWRYTLKDKQGSPYSIEHPSRWLTHKSIERRKRQGLPVDSTDLPVSSRYLKQFEKTCYEAGRNNKRGTMQSTIIGTSRYGIGTSQRDHTSQPSFPTRLCQESRDGVDIARQHQPLHQNQCPQRFQPLG